MDETLREMFDLVDDGGERAAFDKLYDDYQKARAIYPLTVIGTRYGGTYEGGLYAAFNEKPWNVPPTCMDSDIECSEWWESKAAERVGRGSTPQAAIDDLAERMGGYREDGKMLFWPEEL